MKEAKISRKKFLQTLAGITVIPFTLMAGISIHKYQNVTSTKILRLKKPDSKGIFFIDEVIIVNSNNELKVFSSRCTHLGCKINKSENDIMVCPCHGSAFSGEGEVLKGPAPRALRKLNYNTDMETGELIINI
ncbi:MAG: Rieske (2Fe-2S) protein [Bacteroidales bacterium]